MKNRKIIEESFNSKGNFEGGPYGMFEKKFIERTNNLLLKEESDFTFRDDILSDMKHYIEEHPEFAEKCDIRNIYKICSYSRDCFEKDDSDKIYGNN